MEKKSKCGWLSEMNPTLRELILAILIWGVIFCLAFMWFASSKAAFAGGMAAGVVVAIFMALHMYRFIENAIDFPENDAMKYMAKGPVIRALVIILVVLAAWKLGGNLIAIFLGIMTLKIGAYTQPLLHKIIDTDRKG